MTDRQSGKTLRRTWTLTVTDGPDLDTRVDHRQSRGVLGAASASILPLTDDTVSRFHAELEFSSSGVYLRDLDSTNGSFIDGLAINDGFVQAGECFQLGNTEIRLDANDEDMSQEIQTLAEKEQGLRQISSHLVAESKAIRSILATAQLVAPSAANVLLVGAKGTGKEELARFIHQISPCGSGRMITLTVPEHALASAMNATLFGVSAQHENQAKEIVGPGLLERASGGSLFIEHLDRLPPSTRNQLRSTMQTQSTHRLGESEQRKIDVRLLSSSSQSNAGLSESALRHLAAVQLWLPELRDRFEDIAGFAALNLGRGSPGRAWIGPRFQNALTNKTWPQNLDSLRSTLDDLFKNPLRAEPLQQARIEDFIERNRGDVSEVADLLQVSTAAMFSYLVTHNIQLD